MQNFLIDGFPRNQENVDAWNAVVGPGGASVKFMLFFECPLPVLEERIMGRAAYSGRKPVRCLAALETSGVCGCRRR